MPSGTFLPAATRTTAASPHLSGSVVVSPNTSEIALLINCTAATSTPSAVVSLQQKDDLSGSWFTIGSAAAVTGAGQTRAVFTGPIGGSELRTSTVVTGGTDITYSVGYISRVAR